jgi:hypothetical protein
MIKPLRRKLPILLVAAPLMAACAASDDTWYENHCRDKGLAPGSAAFESCVDETRAWVEWTRWRSEHDGKGL